MCEECIMHKEDIRVLRYKIEALERAMKKACEACYSLDKQIWWNCGECPMKRCEEIIEKSS